MDNPLRYSLTMRFKERHILRLLELEPGHRLLDVGCGIGYLCDLSRRQGAQVHGVDASAEALSHARRQVEGHFAGAVAEALPYRDNTFDRIVFADVIEHVPDDHRALAEIARVAKPGARLVVSTPALDGVFTRTWLKTFLHGEEERFQKNYREGYTEERLRGAMAGCDICAAQTAYSNFFVTELFLGLAKLGYALKKARYHSQADLVEVAESKLFAIYKHLVFPVFYWVGRLEEGLVGGRVKGHCLIAAGTVHKPAAPARGGGHG